MEACLGRVINKFSPPKLSYGDNLVYGSIKYLGPVLFEGKGKEGEGRVGFNVILFSYNTEEGTE